jgi:hypothetical protein
MIAFAFVVVVVLLAMKQTIIDAMLSITSYRFNFIEGKQ